MVCKRGAGCTHEPRAGETQVIAVCARVPQPLETREGADSWLMEANGVFNIRLAPHTPLATFASAATTAKNGRPRRRAASGFRLCAVNVLGGFVVPMTDFNKFYRVHASWTKLGFRGSRNSPLPNFAKALSHTPSLVGRPYLRQSDTRCARRPNRWTPRSRRGCIRHP